MRSFCCVCYNIRVGKHRETGSVEDALRSRIGALSVPEFAHLASKFTVAMLPAVVEKSKSFNRDNLMRDIRNYERGKTRVPRDILANFKAAYPERFAALCDFEQDVRPLREGRVRKLLREEVSWSKAGNWHAAISSDEGLYYGDMLILFAVACDTDLIERKYFSRPLFGTLIDERLDGDKSDFAVRCMKGFVDLAKETDGVDRWKIAKLVDFDERTLRRKIRCERDRCGRFRNIEEYERIFEAILRVRFDAEGENIEEAIRDIASDQVECLLLAAEFDRWKPDFSNYPRIVRWLGGQLSVSCSK